MIAARRDWRAVVALSGGVGGARLLDGLAAALPPEALTAIVNTGDDFTHWGLHISPDLDTVMYTLSSLAHEARGWGLARETFEALAMIGRYGGPDWFQLGDRDLGTHILRTMWLREGRTLSEITAQLMAGLGVAHRVLPMADAPRRTLIDTATEGTLAFQDWLVLHRAGPPVTEVRFEGTTEPAPGIIEAIEAAEVVIVCPSNPYVSIDPILTLDGVREAVAAKPVVALSPIVGGKAVKGPLAEMIEALRGEAPGAGAVARHYGELLKGMVVEEGDEGELTGSLPCFATQTVMGGRADRARLAVEVLDFAEGLL